MVSHQFDNKNRIKCKDNLLPVRILKILLIPWYTRNKKIIFKERAKEKKIMKMWSNS